MSRTIRKPKTGGSKRWRCDCERCQDDRTISTLKRQQMADNMSQALVYKEEQASNHQQVWLVVEDSGEQWESCDWVLGAFITELSAKQFLAAKEVSYKVSCEQGIADGLLANAEREQFYVDNIDYTIEQEAELEDILYKKYPHTMDEWETRHFFKVQGPYPLNPTV